MRSGRFIKYKNETMTDPTSHKESALETAEIITGLTLLFAYIGYVWYVWSIYDDKSIIPLIGTIAGLVVLFMYVKFLWSVIHRNGSKNIKWKQLLATTIIGIFILVKEYIGGGKNARVIIQNSLLLSIIAFISFHKLTVK